MQHRPIPADLSGETRDEQYQREGGEFDGEPIGQEWRQHRDRGNHTRRKGLRVPVPRQHQADTRDA
ncbi:hypothetical protein ACRYG1_23100 [Mycobacteroides abscessus]